MVKQPGGGTALACLLAAHDVFVQNQALASGAVAGGKEADKLGIPAHSHYIRVGNQPFSISFPDITFGQATNGMVNLVQGMLPTPIRCPDVETKVHGVNPTAPPRAAAQEGQVIYSIRF